MRLAASQIGWEPEEESSALDILREHGFKGLEIAPTRVAGPQPYSDVQSAADFSAGLRRAFGLSVCSMQSIWFGQSGSMFGPEREALLDYTRQAVLFAEAAGCGNLVFGSPKNRVLPEGVSPNEAVTFFKELGDFAASHGTVIALEANPTLYGTNFINTTAEALAMAEKVDSPGFAVNLDMGTILANNEAVEALKGRVPQLNHVHISEPGLAMLEPRPQHRQLAELLRQEGYTGWVSIEMKAQSLENVDKAAAYVVEVFA